jgi:hypothetical protein
VRDDRIEAYVGAIEGNHLGFRGNEKEITVMATTLNLTITLT